MAIGDNAIHVAIVPHAISKLPVGRWVRLKGTIQLNPNFEALEFQTILEKLKHYALSQGARDYFDRLEPCMEERRCKQRMAETTAARRVLDACGAPPISPMKDLEELLELAGAGAMLTPAQLTATAQFATACKRLGAYLSKGEASDVIIASYGRSLEDLSDLREEIARCVNEEQVYNEASPTLRGIRRKLEHLEGQMKEKLTHILQSRKEYLADGYITTRAGRYVLPVQRRYQSQFGGTVVEVSGKGSTVFMEPASITRLQAERAALAVEEDGEIRRVLYALSALVAECSGDIRRNMEAMEVLDILFAKARLSAALNARAVEIGGARALDLRQARHPLLDPERCVPLDFHMEGGTRGVVITGPNTGGKTVAVKTVGLLSLMAQCGLHLPCGEGSYVAMQDGWWCDIGDSQNLSQNLSTFSGHITNVIRIMEQASRDSLVLLDELGSGTDPAEGMGIAVAVLEELRQRGCMFLVTTHYPQVKTFAERATGVQSARMAFDRESLRPLFQLELGKSGESCALHIAQRLGLPPHLLERARRAVYEQEEQGQTSAASPGPASRLVREIPMKKTVDLTEKFSMGDSVVLLPGGEIGIVYRPADQSGDVVVQVKGVKRMVKHNRLRLKVAAAQLYPPDYDFSILFDPVEHRKARRVMGKRYDPKVSITYTEFEGGER